MSVLSVSGVRKRVQDRITTVLSGQGWRHSRYVPDLFGQDTDQIAPRSFAVGVSSSTPVGDRQRLPVGTVVRTQLVVRFAWRLRADNQLSDYDAALDAEEDVLAAVMSTDLNNLHIELDTIPSRTVSTDGDFFLGELQFISEHRLPLT